MVKRTWLFGLVLVMPILGFAVSTGIQTYFNSEIRTAFHKQLPEADEAVISSLTLNQLCLESRTELGEICDTNDNLNLMKMSSIVSGAVGLALLLIIKIAGTAARNNRNLLLILFKPGLYITALTLIVLILVYAAVAMGAIYYGEAALIQRVHVKFVALIGIGALIGVFAMGRSAFSLVQKAQTFVIGSALTREQAPALWNGVDRIAKKLGALQPDHIVVGLDPNFFVTEADVVCLDGKLSGRTLYCSLPLSRILNYDEFGSIIGHELGHFKGLDTKFSERFYPIYRGTVSSIDSLQTAGGDDVRSIALLPAIAIMSYFLECFSVAESRISRERELAADQAAVSVTNTLAFASALTKVHAFAGLWNNLQESAIQALREKKAFINVSKVYADVVATSAQLEALEGVAENRLPHPTDSHPPLGVRLDALKIKIDDLSKAVLEVNPPKSAIQLIPHSENKEEEISAAYQAILARNIGIELDAGEGEATT